MTSYQYDTLPENAFRLLNIFDDEGSLRCTLCTFSLDNHPAYMALSYTWGSALPGDGLTPDLDHTLICDGAEIAITASLENALASVPLTHAYVWADAVCINQQDLAERSAQVAIMGKIYSRASRVTVWLGVADRSTKTAFDFIHDVASRVPKEVETWDDNKTDQYLSSSGFWDRIGRPKWTAAERHALVRLYLRNWFTRTWVIQEAVFASDPVVICGSNSATWRAMYVASMITRYHDLTNLAINEVKGARRLLRMRDGYFAPIAAIPPAVVLLKQFCKQIPALINDENRGFQTAELLYAAIRLTQCLKATEPRDKIFAPVAMVLHVLPFEELMARLKPDYSKSIVQVFTEASSFLLQHDEKISGRGFFLSVARSSTPSQVEGLPSWVQDYTLSADRTILRDIDCKFNCNAGITPDTNVEFTLVGSTLRLCASRLGTVTELVPLPFYPILSGLAPELLPLLQFAAALPDFDASGDPAILSMIHSVAVGCMREYDYETASARFRKMFTEALCLVATRRQILEEEDSILIGLLEDFERRGIPAFPTLAQLRYRTKGSEPFTIRRDQAFEFIRTTHRQLFQSTEGYLGIVPTTAQSGDEIMFLQVSPVPYVFRKTDRPGEYTLVGEAYVHGVMYGELWREGLQPEWSPVTLV